MSDLADRWDAHADFYDARFAPLTGFIAQSMFRMTESRLVRAPRVLDVACGTGALAVAAAEWIRTTPTGQGGHVVATDFSPTMLERTRAHAAARGIGEAMLTTSLENGQSLRFADASFDAVYSCFGIFLFADRRAGWKEAFRVLRKGGIFVTSVWQGPETNEMFRAQMEPIMKGLPSRLRGPAPPDGWQTIATADALAREVGDAGPFATLRVFPFHATFAVADWQALWEGMRGNPVVGALFQQCTQKELEEIRESVLAHFRVLSGGQGEPLVLESVCNILVAQK